MTDERRPTVKGVSVYRRGHKWAYQVDLGKDLLTGERLRDQKGGFLTEDGAWEAALAAKASGAAQRVTPSDRTLNEFLDEWLKSIETSVKPSTLAHYRDCWGYVKPLIGKRPYQELDVLAFNAFYVHLGAAGRAKADTNSLMYEYWTARQAAGADIRPAELADHVRGISVHTARKAIWRYRNGRLPKATTPGLAPKTIGNIHRMLRRAGADAVAWKYVQENVAAHAALPREKRQSKSKRKRRLRVWSGEQLRTFLELAVDDRDAALWVLFCTAGPRRSEVAGASRELLDLEAAEIDFADTRVVVNGQVIDEDGKTDAGDRTVSLDPITAAYLRRHLEMLDREKRRHGSGYHDTGRLFCHDDGRPINPDTITRRFNRLVDRAGLPQIRLHDVRHSYANYVLDNGGDPKVLADRLGHSNMQVTLTIYGHRSKGTDRKLADEQASSIFGPDWTSPNS